MKVPDELVEAALNGHPESWRPTIERALEAVLPKVRTEVEENAYGGDRPVIRAAFDAAFPQERS